jgi:5-aminolevulinate synthase
LNGGIQSHIVPIIVGHAGLCKRISDQLLHEYKIYIQPINYPTVPVGQERLRLTITPNHTFEDIDYLLASLTQVYRSLEQDKTAA